MTKTAASKAKPAKAMKAAAKETTARTLSFEGLEKMLAEKDIAGLIGVANLLKRRIVYNFELAPLLLAVAEVIASDEDEGHKKKAIPSFLCVARICGSSSGKKQDLGLTALAKAIDLTVSVTSEASRKTYVDQVISHASDYKELPKELGPVLSAIKRRAEELRTFSGFSPERVKALTQKYPVNPPSWLPKP